MKRCGKKLVEFDRYGHQVGVHFKGSGTYNTKLGAIMTLATYTLVLINMVSLLIAFFDSSKQVENSQVKKVDSFYSGPYTLGEESYDVNLITTPALKPELGRFKVTQKFFDRQKDYDVPLIDCKREKLEDMVDYWVPRLGDSFS